MRIGLYLCLCVCALVGSVALGNMAVKGDDPAMMVSPQTIVLAKVAGVTVHTNIPEGLVAPGSVTLNGVAPLAVWADDCGHLAARFAVGDLALSPGNVVLTLQGAYAGDDAGNFSADDEVRVK